MTPLLEQLRAKAKAAIPGIGVEDCDDSECFVCSEYVSVRVGQDFEPGYDICDSCAQEWFADANPETILKILEALDVMQDALKRIHWGDWSAISGQDYAEQFAEEALNRAKEILG